MTLLKSNECHVESMVPTSEKMQKEMTSLESKFENLQMKVVDEELGQLKSDIKQLHEQAEKSKSAVESQFKAVYKCMSMTSRERKEGIFLLLFNAVNAIENGESLRKSNSALGPSARRQNCTSLWVLFYNDAIVRCTGI